jgi:hypothetical protein
MAFALEIKIDLPNRPSNVIVIINEYYLIISRAKAHKECAGSDERCIIDQRGSDFANC